MWSAIVIIIGYATLIGMFGWGGLLVGVAHIGILVAISAIDLSGKQDPPKH